MKNLKKLNQKTLALIWRGRVSNLKNASPKNDISMQTSLKWCLFLNSFSENFPEICKVSMAGISLPVFWLRITETFERLLDTLSGRYFSHGKLITGNLNFQYTGSAIGVDVGGNSVMNRILGFVLKESNNVISLLSLPQLFVNSIASLHCWSAACREQTKGIPWTTEEPKDHRDIMKLKATKLVISSLMYSQNGEDLKQDFIRDVQRNLGPLATERNNNYSRVPT